MFKKSILFFSVFFSIINFSFSQNRFLEDSLDNYINKAIIDWNVPGLAIAIVKDGKVVINKGYGVKSIITKEKVDENTLFQIASNTKAFTGTALAMLNNEKRISMDEKVSKYLPYFKLKDPLASSNTTIRDLLCHRIGFQTFQGDFLNWASNLTRKEIIEKMYLTEAVNPFRYRFGYCNSAFLAAGEVIPAATDTSWDVFVTKRLLNPLKMNRTTTNFSAILSDPNACKPYTILDGKLIELPYNSMDNIAPAASLNSSVNDLTHWLLMQLDSGRYANTQVVPFKALMQTRTSQMLVGDVNSKTFPQKHFNTYGMGWFMSDYYGKKVYEHSGGANGFVTITCFIPEINMGVTVLTNTDANNLFDALKQQIIDLYLNAPYRNYSDLYLKRNKESVLADQIELDKLKKTTETKPSLSFPIINYTGSYQNEFYGNIIIAETDKKLKKENQVLKINFEHHPQTIGYLSPLGENKFLCRYSDAVWGIQVIDFTAKDEKINAVKIKVNDYIDYLSYDFIKK